MTSFITLIAAIITTTTLAIAGTPAPPAMPHVFETAATATTPDILPVQAVIFMEPLFLTAGQPVPAYHVTEAVDAADLDALPEPPAIDSSYPVIEMEPLIIRVNVTRDADAQDGATDTIIEMAPMHIIVDAPSLADTDTDTTRIEGVPVAQLEYT